MIRIAPRTALRLSVLPLLLLLTACGSDPAAPGQQNVQLAIASGDAQFATAGATAAEPLQVLVVDPATKKPVRDITVSWRILDGGGASLTTATSLSDEGGVAATQIRLGSATGSYRVEASAPRLIGPPVVFEIRVVLTPMIETIEPSIATAGETLTITGSNFSPELALNSVLFGGLRGTVLTATANRLTVNVPPCVPNRSLDVRVTLGAVASEPRTIATVGSNGAPLQIARGEAWVSSDPAQLACLRLPPESNAAFLLIAQHAAPNFGVPLRFELRGIAAGSVVTAAETSPVTPAQPFSPSDWELRLRQREAAFRVDGIESLLEPHATPIRVEPNIGDRREFRVLNSDQKTTTRITAEVKAVSQHAIMYQDLEAPANGFNAADFELFGRIFDDPIYPTDVRVFGQPSDVDANGRIIILFTPRVNALTPRNEDSFIAGYFYGCDLVAASRCADTNRSEIFYSMVPDPEGRFSGARTKNIVLRTVPGVLAHEFQHMINFAQKNHSLDALWLSEALAHAAEDIVGDILLQRGETALATDFRQPNFTRAHRYLGRVAQTSMIAEAAPGTLEMRGAAWLFLKYLTGQYGGDDLLGRLTRSSRTGADNIIEETAQPWHQLLAQFAVAIWADGAPELQGVPLDARLTFANFNLRSLSGQSPFALRPRTQSYQDFLLSDELPSASQDYMLVQAGTATTAPLNISLTGVRGGPFTTLDAAPQLVILRVR